MASLVATCILPLPDVAWKWIHRLGGPGLILLGIADNSPVMSAPPGTIDTLVIVLAAHRHAWWAYYALMAAIGEVIGGYVTYRLAEKGGQATLEKKVGKNRAEKLYKTFEKHGSASVLVGSMLPPPFPFTPVLITAGVMHYPKSQFLVALTIGRLLRFLTAAGLGRIYGRQIVNVFSAHYRFLLDLLIVVTVAAGMVAIGYFVWYRSKLHKQKKAPQSETRASNSAHTHAAR
jgi:membrane protein YqaA with SNARE-associated domain